MSEQQPGSGEFSAQFSVDARMAQRALGQLWPVVLGLGALSLIVGILALAWPGKTILVAAWLLAIWLFVSGIFQIGMSFNNHLQTFTRVMLVISGVIGVLLGIFAFQDSFQAVSLLVIFIGISWLFQGIMQLGSAFSHPESPTRAWDIFGGILMVIGSFVVLFWPEISVLTMAVVFGAWLVIIGVLQVVSAFRMRSVTR